MRRFRDARCELAALLAAASILFPAACRRQGQPPAAENDHYLLEDQAKQTERILEVEGTIYTNADFLKYLKNSLGASLDSLTAAALSRLYDEFADEKILLKKAQSDGVSLSEGEKSAYIARLKNALRTDQGEEPALDSDAPALIENLLVEKYISRFLQDVTVDDQEITDYYEQHRGDFLQPERVQVSQILLPSEGRASDVLNKLAAASEGDFRKIAQSQSGGPEAAKGGVMGVFKAGQLPPELEKVIFSLGEGEISRVVQSTYGYHIFRLDKKFEPRLLSAAEAAPAIRAKLQEQKSKAAVSAHLETLRTTMVWKPYLENLAFPYQRIKDE